MSSPFLTTQSTTTPAHAPTLRALASQIFTVSSDMSIKELGLTPGAGGGANATAAPTGATLTVGPKVQCDVALGSLALTQNGRVLLAGTCDPGRPGLIQVRGME